MACWYEHTASSKVAAACFVVSSIGSARSLPKYTTSYSISIASQLGNRMTPGSSIRLIFRRTESCIRIRHIGHIDIFFSILGGLGVVVVVVVGHGVLDGSLGLLFRRALDESSLDPHSSVGKILATIVSNLLVPHPSRSFVLKSSNNGSPFGRCVNANPTVLAVDLRMMVMMMIGSS